MTKVLLVEDNDMNRDILTRRLSSRGFQVEVAVDGGEGIQLASQLKPDLILMDVSLPGIDGLEATRQIKANPETASIPVIALTAHVFEEDQRQAKAAGCSDFDTKPIDLERLLAKMKAVLEN